MVRKGKMSGEKKGGSQLASEGLTLAQIGAAFCHAVVDAGGNDQIAKLILNNPATRKDVGELVMRPHWEVVSNAESIRKFAESSACFCDMYGFALMRKFFSLSKDNPKIATDNIVYQLRGILLRDQRNTDEIWEEAARTSSGSFYEETPLEVAVLMRMQIQPKEMGFPLVVIMSVFFEGRTKYLPALMYSGAMQALSCPVDLAALPRGTAFVFLESKHQLVAKQ